MVSKWTVIWLFRMMNGWAKVNRSNHVCWTSYRVFNLWFNFILHKSDHFIMSRDEKWHVLNKCRIPHNWDDVKCNEIGVKGRTWKTEMFCFMTMLPLKLKLMLVHKRSLVYVFVNQGDTSFTFLAHPGLIQFQRCVADLCILSKLLSNWWMFIPSPPEQFHNQVELKDSNLITLTASSIGNIQDITSCIWMDQTNVWV